MAHYQSKHGTVSKSPEELYMSFVDMRNFTAMLPEKFKGMVTADYDNISATVQGFRIAVRVSGRVPYSLIQIASTESPVGFGASIHFDPAEPGKTDFSIEADADLNLMMKAMLGKKLQEALDKVVDALVAVSEGRMPEGMPAGFNPGDYR